MKIDAVTLSLGVAAAYLLIKNVSASSDGVGGASGGTVGTGTVQTDHTPAQPSPAPTYSPEQLGVLATDAQLLYNAAVPQNNAVEAARAIGMLNLAQGTPIGVSASTAQFIQSTNGGNGAATSTPSNYIQTGGALRYVGPRDAITGNPV